MKLGLCVIDIHNPERNGFKGGNRTKMCFFFSKGWLASWAGMRWVTIQPAPDDLLENPNQQKKRQKRTPGWKNKK